MHCEISAHKTKAGSALRVGFAFSPLEVAGARSSLLEAFIDCAQLNLSDRLLPLGTDIAKKPENQNLSLRYSWKCKEALTGPVLVDLLVLHNNRLLHRQQVSLEPDKKVVALKYS